MTTSSTVKKLQAEPSPQLTTNVHAAVTPLLSSDVGRVDRYSSFSCRKPPRKVLKGCLPCYGNVVSSSDGFLGCPPSLPNDVCG